MKKLLLTFVCLLTLTGAKSLLAVAPEFEGAPVSESSLMPENCHEEEVSGELPAGVVADACHRYICEPYFWGASAVDTCKTDETVTYGEGAEQMIFNVHYIRFPRGAVVGGESFQRILTLSPTSPFQPPQSGTNRLSDEELDQLFWGDALEGTISHLLKSLLGEAFAQGGDIGYGATILRPFTWEEKIQAGTVYSALVHNLRNALEAGEYGSPEDLPYYIVCLLADYIEWFSQSLVSGSSTFGPMAAPMPQIVVAQIPSQLNIGGFYDHSTNLIAIPETSFRGDYNPFEGEVLASLIHELAHAANKWTGLTNTGEPLNYPIDEWLAGLTELLYNRNALPPGIDRFYHDLGYDDRYLTFITDLYYSFIEYSLDTPSSIEDIFSVLPESVRQEFIYSYGLRGVYGLQVFEDFESLEAMPDLNASCLEEYMNIYAGRFAREGEPYELARWYDVLFPTCCGHMLIDTIPGCPDAYHPETWPEADRGIFNQAILELARFFPEAWSSHFFAMVSDFNARGGFFALLGPNSCQIPDEKSDPLKRSPQPSLHDDHQKSPLTEPPGSPGTIDSPPPGSRGGYSATIGMTPTFRGVSREAVPSSLIQCTSTDPDRPDCTRDNYRWCWDLAGRDAAMCSGLEAADVASRCDLSDHHETCEAEIAPPEDGGGGGGGGGSGGSAEGPYPGGGTTTLYNPDVDGDGTPNTSDPDDDNDAIPDTADPDDDNDGIEDNSDYFPGEEPFNPGPTTETCVVVDAFGRETCYSNCACDINNPWWCQPTTTSGVQSCPGDEPMWNPPDGESRRVCTYEQRYFEEWRGDVLRCGWRSYCDDEWVWTTEDAAFCQGEWLGLDQHYVNEPTLGCGFYVGEVLCYDGPEPGTSDRRCFPDGNNLACDLYCGCLSDGTLTIGGCCDPDFVEDLYDTAPLQTGYFYQCLLIRGICYCEAIDYCYFEGT